MPDGTRKCAKCGIQMPSNKRPHAIYCTRKCKMASAEQRRPQRDNKERYKREQARRKAYAVQQYWNDADASRAASREWRKNNPEKRKVQHQRRRAKKLAATIVDFTTEQWVEKKLYWGDRCYLRIPGICSGDGSTMDHVKPLDGGGPHTLANVRPACQPCNSSKNDSWPYPVSAGPTAAA